MEAPRPLSGSRRLRAVDLARGLCVGALSLALLVSAAVPAGAATGPGLFVTLPGGGQAQIPTASMATNAPGVIEEQFQVRARAGESPGTTTHRGLPVGRALREYAGVESFGYLTVPRPTGTTAYISGKAFAEPSLDFEAGLAALFSYNEGSTRFVRPAYEGRPEDVNAEDSIATVTGEPLVVGVHEGAAVQVGASASTTSAEAGSAVGFTATESGGEPGEGFSFEWRFGDGSTATGESVSHSFTGAGTYEVRVVAVGNQESGGESGPLSIVVGSPPPTVQPGATPAPEPKRKARPKRPTGAGGGGKAPQPAHGGSGSGGHGGEPGSEGTSHEGPAAADEARPAGPAAPGPTAPATPGSTPRAPESAPIPPPSTVTPPALAEESATPSPAPASSPPTRGATKPPASQSSTGVELVEGRLVGDDLGPVSAAEAAAGPSSAGGSRPAPGAVGDAGFGVPVVALIVVALLGAGALFEWRRRPPVRR